MTKPVKFQEMLASLRRCLEAVPEHRTGHHTQYTIVDAGLGAFSVFFLQSPSFLAYQQKMREHHGRDNAKSLFGMEEIPSTPQDGHDKQDCEQQAIRWVHPARSQPAAAPYPADRQPTAPRIPPPLPARMALCVMLQLTP